MPLFRTLSLRQLLTVPYVVLVLLLAILVGLLSYRAGRTAVDSLSEQLLGETVGRIAQAVEKHVFGSGAVLDVAFPRGLTAPPVWPMTLTPCARASGRPRRFTAI
jgi:hypothetical protein